MFDLTIVFFPLPLGSTFICNTHIIPVKNQEGVAMMFIINFEYVTDEDSAASPERVNPILPVKSVNRKYKAHVHKVRILCGCCRHLHESVPT